MKLSLLKSSLKGKTMRGACTSLIAALLLPNLGLAENSGATAEKNRVLKNAAYWQNITGSVKDVEGRPLVGVSVKVKGSKAATSTDANGVFRLNLPEGGNHILVISYIGFKQIEVAVNGKTQIDVVLEESSLELEQIVVTGYTAQKKSSILGAVATISGKELEDIPAPNIAAALRNRIAGVGVSQNSGRPGADIRLNIRNSNIAASAATVPGNTAEPLYIIDRITVTSEQFNALDPSQVESITVLKDASAAIYGAAGAKGVVLITTKRGKIGKPSITYNGYVGISDAARTPEMLSAYQQAKAINDLYDAEGTRPYSDYFSEQDLEMLKNSTTKSWYDEIWKSALTQRHNLSISGGSEKITYFAGGNYQNENANYADMSQNRYGFRSGITTTITEGLKADIAFSVNQNTQYSKNGLNATDQAYYQTLITTPKWIPIQIDGKPVNYNGIKNPLSIVQSGYYSNNKSTNYQINAALTYTPTFLKGFAANFRLAQTGNNTANETYTAPYRMNNFIRSGNNMQFYTNQLDPISPTTEAVSQQNARLNPSLSKASSYQGFLTLQYNKKIAKHNIFVLAGAERSRGRDENMEVLYSGQNVYGIPEAWAFDQTLTAVRARTKNESIKQSFFSNLNYDFDEKYYLSGIVRADASSNFVGDNVWGVFPTVSAGWAVSKEDFFKNNINFISYLKLRASYGITGDDRIRSYLWKERYSIDLVNTGYIYGSNTVGSANPGEVPNKDITWESARTLNIGLDANFLDDKFSFTFDYYHRFNYDQYDRTIQDSFPWYAGFLPPVVNNYETHTYGIEFSLGYKTQLAKDLYFNTNINFGYSNGYVSQMFNNPFKLFVNDYQDWQYQLGTATNKWNEGNFGLKNIGMFRSQAEVDEWLRKYPNYTLYGKVPEPGWLNFEDTNKDGIIDDKDFRPMYDNPNPLQFGLTLGFKYKGFALNTNIAASIGGKAYYDSRSLEKPTVSSNVSSFPLDYWTPQNTDAKFPRFDDPSAKRPSTFWAVNGTMIRINNMDLSYALPASLAGKIGVSTARILVTGNNLWTIVNPLKYKDPYTSSIYDYPTIRTVSVGLSVGL